jgi:transposase
MSRFRLYPTPEQEHVLFGHTGHARYVWNLAVEQQSWWTQYRRGAPSSVERMRQLTEARAAFDWLAEGSVKVQQQALRDFDNAMAAFFRGTARRPTYRKRGVHEGFRIVSTGPQHVRRLNRKWAEVRIPKVGWVRFRRHRDVPDFRSFRVKFAAGRWHVAFAAVPDPIPSPDTGEVVGIDRGVTRAVTLSTGEHYDYARPDLDLAIRRLQRRLARAKRGSNRRAALKARLARAKARHADTRKDFIEKTTTDIARRFDIAVLEDLDVRAMTSSGGGAAKRGLNRGILDKGWGLFEQRLDDKAAGRVVRVPAAHTSQRCSACGTVDREARESQAAFRCRACGFSANADVNAAANIAARYAVTARGGRALALPANREPRTVPAWD